MDEGLLPRPIEEDMDGLDASRSQNLEPRLDVTDPEREVVDALPTMREKSMQETVLPEGLEELDRTGTGTG